MSSGPPAPIIFISLLSTCSLVATFVRRRRLPDPGHTQMFTVRVVHASCSLCGALLVLESKRRCSSFSLPSRDKPRKALPAVFRLKHPICGGTAKFFVIISSAENGTHEKKNDLPQLDSSASIGVHDLDTRRSSASLQYDHSSDNRVFTQAYATQPNNFLARKECRTADR